MTQVDFTNIEFYLKRHSISDAIDCYATISDDNGDWIGQFDPFWSMYRTRSPAERSVQLLRTLMAAHGGRMHLVLYTPGVYVCFLNLNQP